ncbi:NAD(P)-dependent oxidoreductase [Hyphomicrobium sp.]|uniref:NAD(P)-dependent oxidoreductase n=1 Tax=Hyphomicrobium sp. TaxID=82 RepID=UPI002E315E4E|nr:NAD(P)-dependent oxidoreductase [Hyphomicrobium sp.]HEX2842908.1 NAD(P)-dependent oxidoreductase [Hyphomicrobium sp.]
MAKVAWIGLGVMGYPMAGHLLTRGSQTLAVYNRNPAKAEAWVSSYGAGERHATPASAAKNADFVFSCVGNDDDLRQVTLGAEGAFAAMKPGAVFIDHTTASADVARELHAEGTKRGISFIDAPVSGGQAGAEAGQLTVMCGGDEEAFRSAEPLIRCFAKAARLLGPAGAGQLTKMVNQIAIAGLVQSLSEAIAFAENAGLDVAAVIDTISKGAAQSWQMENRWKTMHERRFDFGFAVDWMRKDLGICLAEAKRNGSSLSVAELVDRYYGDVQANGGSRWDTSSLITRLPSPAAKT